MPRGEAQLHKVIYRGGNGADYVVFVDDTDSYNKYKASPDSTPLVQVVSNFSVQRTTQGNQGVLDTASKADLENEFGSTGDEVIKKILADGKFHESKVRLSDLQETLALTLLFRTVAVRATPI